MSGFGRRFSDQITPLTAEQEALKPGSRDISFFRGSYKSGVPFVEGRLVNGAPQGQWQLWYENGNLWQKAYFNQGMKNGPWSVSYEDGTPWLEGVYRRNLRVGQWRYYWPNGNLMCEGEYEDDMRTGQWGFWNEDGQLLYKGYDLSGFERLDAITLPKF